MRSHLIPLALLLCCATTAWGQNFQGTCTVDFIGTSTLHDFAGTAACEPFLVEIEQNPGAAPVIENAQVRIAVAGMQTGRETRDEKMREMFDSDQHPYILGVWREVNPDEVRQRLKTGGDGSGAFEFGLKIRDITHRISARAENFVETDGGMAFDLRFDVSLAAYELEPPSVLGLIRVGDTVRVKVAVDLARAAAAETKQP